MRRILELANDELIESLVAQRVPNPLEDAIAMVPIAALTSDGCMQYLMAKAGPTLCHALVAVLPKRRAELQEFAANTKSDELFDRLVGKRVRIDGVVGRPELNGKLGTAVRYYTEKGRYAVEVAGEPPRDTAHPRWIGPRPQYIGQLELLAAVVTYTTFPDVLAGKHVIHWIDNESAVYSLAKGYSGAADSARVVNLYHACVAQLGVTPWLEYVCGYG